MKILVVQQQYESEVNNEYVIRGNAAILKCSIPSFVADFVNVVSWEDDSGNSYTTEESKKGNGTTNYGYINISTMHPEILSNFNSIHVIF